MTLADLSPEHQARAARKAKIEQEVAKDPTTLSLPERVARIEAILGIEIPK